MLPSFNLGPHEAMHNVNKPKFVFHSEKATSTIDLKYYSPENRLIQETNKGRDRYFRDESTNTDSELEPVVATKTDESSKMEYDDSTNIQVEIEKDDKKNLNPETDQ